jgi:hypothetical protein
MKVYLTRFSNFIQKYAFSKKHGKIVAIIVLISMILLFLYGSGWQLEDSEKLVNGFSISFGFAIILYAVLYALAYEIIPAIILIISYSIAYFLGAYPTAQDVMYAIGGIAMLVIFIKWAGKIKDPTKTVHPDEH